jgi:predicted pyridoxine 5'-phosphate oxidase superfamily flavin-nucleotide-binding protein
MNKFQHVAFTPRVLEAQHSAYGRTYAVTLDPGRDPLGPDEVAFVEARDSFYMATISESGWPYVQHRGGPPGLLAALDAHTIAFADLRGNRQLVSAGNLTTNDRLALILVDYPNRARLKLFAHAELVRTEADPALTARLAPQGKAKHVERLVRLHVVGFDWNCPQNITPRYTQTEVEVYVASLGKGPASKDASS